VFENGGRQYFEVNWALYTQIYQNRFQDGLALMALRRFKRSIDQAYAAYSRIILLPEDPLKCVFVTWKESA
jgi:hypothetical protein